MTSPDMGALCSYLGWPPHQRRRVVGGCQMNAAASHRLGRLLVHPRPIAAVPISAVRIARAWASNGDLER